MKIAVYATDHGFGHLSRQLGWIERIPWGPDDEIHIVNDKASSIIDHIKVPNIQVHRRTTDMGPIFNNQTLEIDSERTKQELDKWYNKIDDQVRFETDWMNEEGIDAVISDISPVPIESSFKSNIPSLALSSFSWYWIYNDIAPDHPINEKILSMYRKATDAYVLPLTEEMSIFPRRKEISLISRVSEGIVDIKSRKKKIFVSMGYSVFPDLRSFLKNPEHDFIVPHHLETKADVIRIPIDDTNITPYLRSADLALMKTGYSSISEAIVLKKPIIAVKRKMIEDEFTGRTIEELGIGVSVFLENLKDFDIKNFNLESHRIAYDSLSSLYQNTGWKKVNEWINKQV